MNRGIEALLQELAPNKPTKWANWSQKLAEEGVETENDLLELAEEDFGGLPVSAALKSVLRKFRSSRSNAGAGGGQQPSLSTELQSGSLIERYTIVRLIQTSDKTKTSLASEEDEEYILKQVLDPSAFSHEVACLELAKSKDPTCAHVVKYIRSFEENGSFIAMEAGGQTAVQWRDNCGMPVPAMLLKIGPDLLNAIEFLHTEVGLIHCYIKLSNLVVFGGPKKIKFVDVGAAQKAGEELTEYTVANLAPEAAQGVIDGQSIQASTALDVWAAGILLVSVCDPQWLEQASRCCLKH
jgi:serine/threonine protein kinase